MNKRVFQRVHSFKDPSPKKNVVDTREAPDVALNVMPHSIRVARGMRLMSHNQK